MGEGEVKDQVSDLPADHLLSAEDRARTLREELAYHEHRYHVLESPLLSKRRYWELRRELAELEGLGVQVAADSASWRAGAPPRELALGAHEPPWEAPLDIRSEPELRAYLERVAAIDPRHAACVGTACLVGVEASLSYVDGCLIRARLRGDGRDGFDVTPNVRTIGSVPLRLRPAGTVTESRVTKVTADAARPATITPVPPAPAALEVRGTVTMRVLDFMALDRERVDAGEPPFLDLATMVESALTHRDPAVTAARRLCFFAEHAHGPSEIETHWKLLGALKSWGFRVTSLAWRCEGLSEILDFVGTLQQERPSFELPLEGGLLTVNRRSFVRGEDEPPVAERARLVFQTKGRAATVSRLYHAVGRSGSIFPVALLERPDAANDGPEAVPIPAGSRRELVRVTVGAPGKTIAGAIAPRLIGEEGGSAPEPVPDACPACGGALRRLEYAPFVRCPNERCRGRTRARFLHMVGPRGLAISSMSAKVVDALESEGVRQLPDLFALEADKVEAAAAGAGRALEAARDANRRMPLWRVLYLSSIPELGERAARLAASLAGTAGGLVSLHDEQLAHLDPEARAGLVAWLSSEGPEILARLEQLGVEVIGEGLSFAAPFAGKSVALAGRFEQLGNERVIDELERRGARLVPRVNRRTELVLAGTEAEEVVGVAAMYGTPVVSEALFVDFLRTTHVLTP